ncbi:MAG: diacylglycerol kinase family protein [Velocimicrobium sp.]
MRKKMLFIYNPHAGKEALKNKLSDVLEIFMDADYEVTIYATKQSKEATDIVKLRGDKFDLIVCSGGDGTLNEVTDGLMTLENRPPCGYIPTGTVNDFATTLHIPKNIIMAANNVIEGELFPCDIGSLNGDFYNYIAAFGAFTEVAYETSQEIKNIFGRMAYFLDGVKRLPNLKSYHIKVELETESFEDEIIFGMITNSKSVGGFKGITGRNVKLDDGLFEVALIKNPQNAGELQAIVNSLLTREANSKYIYAFATSHIILSCEDEISWTLDGEYGGSFKQAEIVNYKQAIRYIKGKKSK